MLKINCSCSLALALSLPRIPLFHSLSLLRSRRGKRAKHMHNIRFAGQHGPTLKSRGKRRRARERARQHACGCCVRVWSCACFLPDIVYCSCIPLESLPVCLSAWLPVRGKLWMKTTCTVAANCVRPGPHAIHTACVFINQTELSLGWHTNLTLKWNLLSFTSICAVPGITAHSARRSRQSSPYIPFIFIYCKLYLQL